MSAPLLDRAVIDDLFDFIGVKAVRPVIELFLSESRELVGRIEQSAADDPAGREAIRRAATPARSAPLRCPKRQPWSSAPPNTLRPTFLPLSPRCGLAPPRRKARSPAYCNPNKYRFRIGANCPRELKGS